jgi:hypothetical protein
VKTLCTAAIAIALFGSWASAGTVNLVSNTSGSTSSLGAFTGTATYDDVSVLTITLKNTTPSGGGYITGFLFNIDGDATATLSPNPTGNFSDLVTSGNLSGNPFGDFDAGAALGGNFLGGGSPNSGIAVGAERTFTFNLTGDDASSLRIGHFFTELSDGSDDHDAGLLVRFRGIQLGEGSDKVPGFPTRPPGGETPIPLPAAAWSAMSVFGLMGGKKFVGRIRARRSA